MRSFRASLLPRARQYAAPNLRSFIKVKRFKPYLHFIKPVLPQLIIALLCGVIFGVASGFGIPYMIKVLFPKIFEERGETIATLALYCSLPALVMAVRGVAGYFNTYLTGYCGQVVLEGLRVMVFQKIQRLPLTYFLHRDPGDTITRTMQDTGLIQNTMIEFSIEIIKQPVTMMGAIGFLVYLAFQQADITYLLLFLAAIPASIYVIRQVGKKLKSRVLQMQGQLSELMQRLNQNLSAVKEIRAFGLEEREIGRFREASGKFIRFFMKVVKYNIMISPIIEVVSAIGIGAALLYAYHSHITSEAFISMAMALYLSYEPVKRLGRLNNKIQEGMAGLERIETLLHEPEPICDPVNPHPVDRLQGTITFERASFAYDEAPVLRNINVTLSAGKTYALVGPSGAGKTTFANLIPRFYEITQGAVKIDGIDIRQMRIADLRRNIAIVPQDPVLLSDTIYNNILIGDLQATRDEVEAAAHKAFAHEFIMQLDAGYDTDVGNLGNRLSGGQKQRLALARAFLRNSPILIMDEATSALDTNSEKAIQQALENLITGKTVILIAHRFSSIRHADHILVFNMGEIVEQGDHHDLIGKQGLYHSLYMNQTHADTTPSSN